MGSTCKCCKGTKFIGHSGMCTLCAKTSALSPAVSEEDDEPTIPCLSDESSEDVASDCGLSRRCEQSEAAEERLDALAQTTEPQNPGLVQATIDPFPVGRTDIGSSQDFDKSEEAALKYDLSILCEGSEAQEERMHELAQSTEPKNPALVEATIDPFLVGRTEIGSSQGEDNPDEDDSYKPDDDPGHPEADCAVIFRSSLSGALHERVTERIREIQPGTSVFVAIMRQCDIQLPSPLLIISNERVVAAAARFPHENGTIILQMPGKSKDWWPRFFVEKDMCMLAGNWLDFVCDNQVQEGDICIFVPAKGGGRSTFMVHLIRAEAAHPRGVKRGRSRHGTEDAEISSTEGPSHGGNASLENNINGVVPPGFLNGEDSHDPSEHGGIILRSYDNLSTSQRKIVDERVQAIRSGYPLYVVQINNSHRCLRKQFEFSKKYAKAIHLPKEERRMILWSMGKQWTTSMASRKIDKKDRWFITRGWNKFACGSGVHETGLRSGDLYLFELKSMNEEVITMEVHVIPKEQF